MKNPTNPAVIVSILLFSAVALFGQVSDEARRHFDRGTAAVETAKAPEDYTTAITEFQQAVQLAPDWANGYYNLGMVQEKAGKYADAIASLQNYLRLAPDASDAQAVKSLINKIEFKKDKDDAIKRVYDLMTSENYRVKLIGDLKKGGDTWVSNYGLGLYPFRRVDGELQAHNGMSRYMYHATALEPPREWVPVEVNGKFFKYAYQYYMDISTGYTVREDVEVNGEIISADPPRVKETTKTSITWGMQIPDDPDSRGRPFNKNFNGTGEYEYELQAK